MTPDWDSLLDASGLAKLLPAEYAHFARPLQEGLSFFLKGLSAAEQQSMLQAQARLPIHAPISQRLGLLARQSPVLQKMGQVLSRDRRLPEELRQHLRALESLEPTVSLESLESTLKSELGPLSKLGVTLRPPALAEASVAAVIPYEQARTGASEPTDGVFKILKPGIEDRLYRELALLRGVGEYLDERCDELRIPHLDYQDAFKQVQEKLKDEVQLENEQRHLTEARACFSNDASVLIPRLQQHCTRRVTAMERVYGVKVTQCEALSRNARKRLASLVARAMLAHPLLSTTDPSLFHGDPHAGNIFYTTDGRLALLDWSLVGRLGETERAALVQVLIGAATLDSHRIVSVLGRLADRQRLDVAALRGVAQDWCRRIRRGMFPGLTCLVGMLDDATRIARLRLGPDLMLFRKSLHCLEGVVEEVGESRGQIDRVLCLEFLRHFALEWPSRWFRSPFSHDYPTRVSTADLAGVAWGGPVTAARCWTGYAADMMNAYAQRSRALSLRGGDGGEP